MPRIAVCTDLGHCSPFDALSGCFFNQGENAFILGGRGSGKSYLFAILQTLNSFAFDHCHTLSSGAIEEQADRVLAYVQHLVKLPVFSSIYDPRQARVREIEYRNGSSSKIVPGTIAALNGPHPQKLLLDELELFDLKALKESTFIVRPADGVDQQVVKTTSRKRAYGPAQREIEAIEQGNSDTTLYIWCVFDAMTTCVEDSCLPCKRRKRSDGKSFYDICYMGADKNGEDIMRAKKADGHFDYKTAWAQFSDPQIDPDDFDSQSLSLRPSQKGLIWPAFNPQVHLKDEDFFAERFSHEPKPLPVLASLDHGWRDATVVLFGYWLKGQLYVLDEIYQGGLQPVDVAGLIEAKCQERRWALQTVYCDPSNPQNIALYSSEGLPVTEANNTVEVGNLFVAGLFRYNEGQEPGLYSSKRCVKSIQDWKTYHFKDQKPEELAAHARRVPDPRQSDHGSDALRYLAMSGYAANTESYTVGPADAEQQGDWAGWDTGFARDIDGW